MSSLTLPPYVTLVPAYGRDYKTKKAVLQDFNDGKDFIMQSYDSQGYINKEQIDKVHKESPIRAVNIRYKQLTQIAVINYK